jgi:hypothetical protein
VRWDNDAFQTFQWFHSLGKAEQDYVTPCGSEFIEGFPSASGFVSSSILFHR